MEYLMWIVHKKFLWNLWHHPTKKSPSQDTYLGTYFSLVWYTEKPFNTLKRMPGDNKRSNLFRYFQWGRTASQFDICFRCGLGHHFRRDCRAQLPSGMSPEKSVSQFFKYTQPIPWGTAAVSTPQTTDARKTGNWNWNWSFFLLKSNVAWLTT